MSIELNRINRHARGAIAMATLLAIAGYYYTALNLTNCLFVTFGFAVVVELGRALIRRFVLVRRRAAHIEKARRTREAQIEAEKQARKQAAVERQRRIEAGENVDDDNSALTPVESMPEPADESTDIDSNAGQANQLKHRCRQCDFCRRLHTCVAGTDW